MSTKKNYHPSTIAIHSGNQPDPSTGAVATPIFQTSTYAQESPGVHKGYEYGRTQNPTRTALETTIADLENGKYCSAFASGMAAIDAITRLLSPNDTLLCSNDLYGGAYRFFSQVLGKYGIKTKFIDFISEDISQHIDESTKMLWFETPTNPLMQIIDIKRIADKAHAINPNILVCVDNTFATPYLQRPLDLGVDIVSHSLTKYMGGHSDVIMGATVCNDPKVAERISFFQNACGGVPGPQDCYLIQRGIKTLPLRMERHSQNAETIAQYLEQHPKVSKVNYPALKSHLQHDLAKKQMPKGATGMVSFYLKDATLEKTFEVIKHFHLFTIAESLGAVESLVGHPASMTHASIPREEREAVGVTDTLIRFSVGIENIDDLLEDIEQALNS